MKNEINSIKKTFESILGYCVEAAEFMNKSELFEVIAKEVNRGMKECDELEEMRMNIESILSKRLDCLKKDLKTIEAIEEENLNNAKETDSPKFPVP